MGSGEVRPAPGHPDPEVPCLHAPQAAPCGTRALPARGAPRPCGRARGPRGMLSP